MIRSRSLDPSGDLCCLPSPHRIPQGVAGMAFNFSQVELSHVAAHRTAPALAENQRGSRFLGATACFSFSQYSPAT